MDCENITFGNASKTVTNNIIFSALHLHLITFTPCPFFMFLSLFICYFLLVDKTKVGTFFYIPNFFATN